MADVIDSQGARRRARPLASHMTRAGAAMALALALWCGALAAPAGSAAEHQRVMALYARSAPSAPMPLSALGRGKGVVFSPDFSTRSNRDFYEALGFAYFEGPSWRDIIARIYDYNEAHPGAPVETLILETHGTNGHGLKLQDGDLPTSRRSYISIAGLQEQLQGSGVRLCVVAACNSGRLFRPEIYYRLDPDNGDKLFKPATDGIVDASEAFDATASDVVVARRADSHIENTTEGRASDLAPGTLTLLEQALGRRLGGQASSRATFVVSDLFVQLLVADPTLRLTATGYEEALVHAGPSYSDSERIYARLVKHLDRLAGSPERRSPARKASAPRKKPRVTAPRTPRTRSTHQRAEG